jgi:hypothetical protein
MTAPLSGITRLHGAALPATLTGGYQLKFYKFAAAGFFTNAAGNSYTVNEPGSVFEKAVRAIEQVATIVVLGTPTSAGFVIGVDGGDFYGRGDSTGYAVGGAGDTALETMDAIIEAALGGSVTTTEVSITGVAFA